MSNIDYTNVLYDTITLPLGEDYSRARNWNASKGINANYNWTVTDLQRGILGRWVTINNRGEAVIGPSTNYTNYRMFGVIVKTQEFGLGSGVGPGGISNRPWLAWEEGKLVSVATKGIVNVGFCSGTGVASGVPLRQGVKGSWEDVDSPLDANISWTDITFADISAAENSINTSAGGIANQINTNWDRAIQTAIYRINCTNPRAMSITSGAGYGDHCVIELL